LGIFSVPDTATLTPEKNIRSFAQMRAAAWNSPDLDLEKGKKARWSIAIPTIKVAAVKA
jgi:hypothetical protein